MSDIVYLDYAATAAVRPPEVVEAVTGYLRDIGATPGRGTHAQAIEAGRTMLRCRKALAQLFGVEGDPGRIVFQLNATYALNAALSGLLRPGDAVVRTRYDHNAIRRPVALLARRGVEERVVSGYPDGRVDLDEVRTLIAGDGRPARVLVLPHASNVMGIVLPVREMADVAHELGALVVLDAAQTAGHYPLDVRDLGVDLLAFTGHKGLLGPQGTGGLWVREGVDLEVLVAGGTGSESEVAEMPAALPDHLEAGTQNGPGIAGLLAGTEWLLARDMAMLRQQEEALKEALIRGLQQVPGVCIRSPVASETVGIVTVTVEGISPSETSVRLEREFGILTRAGLHCAPEPHQIIGTLHTGAVRFSLGWASTLDDIERAVGAIAAIKEAA